LLQGATLRSAGAAVKCEFQTRKAFPVAGQGTAQLAL